MMPCGDPILRLVSHGYEVRIDPARGGRIVSATFGGRDVLRPDTSTGAASALESSCFPLVPFSNRIRNGAFAFQGRSYQLARNWEGDAHVIHGEGWQRAWDVIETGSCRARLLLRGTDWWPWKYECVQEIALGESGIVLSLKLRNTDTAPMPAGLGFHPYFPRTGETRLRFDAAAVWPPLQGPEPKALALDEAYSFAAPRRVSDRVLDHCYEGWQGPASIVQPDTGLQVSVTALKGARRCVVYTPAGEPYFCFEPVSHRTAAFEAPDPFAAGLTLLQPGEELDLAIAIQARLAAP